MFTIEDHTDTKEKHARHHDLGSVQVYPTKFQVVRAGSLTHKSFNDSVEALNDGDYECVLDHVPETDRRYNCLVIQV